MNVTSHQFSKTYSNAFVIRAALTFTITTLIHTLTHHELP